MKIDFNSPVGRSMGVITLEGPRVGIELEYEKSNGERPTLMYWRTEIDHSLRQGGVEYISMPLIPSKVHDQIQTAVSSAKRIKGKVTKRCGLHVHLNVTHLTWGELYSHLAYYTLLEPALFADFAPGREMSHFCVPTWTNTALTQYIYQDGMKLRQGINIPNTPRASWGKASQFLRGDGGHINHGALRMLRTPKYAALNMGALKSFGTLEFRQAPSSLDPVYIERWVKVLLAIQKEAARYNDAQDIVAEYERNGLHALCDRVGFYPTVKPDELDQEDAIDTATIIAGHMPIDWEELQWEM